jgi:uncharacterized protein
MGADHSRGAIVAAMDRLAPTRRPEGPAAAPHAWRELLFVHWEVPVERVRALVPPDLEVDTFEGRAFVGLVPFTMPRVTVPWLPVTLAFHETNVRTYVHRAGRDPGVWFFSLDAASRLAVLGARALFHLPYHFARMRLERRGDAVAYESQRRWPGPRPATLRATWTVGRALGSAAPGTLEHFLCERYVLYARRGERLHQGRVHHPPYPLHEARLDVLEDGLVRAAGFDVGAPMSVLYSPGVDVEVFALSRG